MGEKCTNFIDEIRVWARDYRAIMERGKALSNRWGALYIADVLTEEDFTGTTAEIIASGSPATKKASLVAVIGNMETLAATFDSGYDTNFERVT